VINELTPLYVIEWGETGNAAYCCRNCADEWAQEYGLEWHNPSSLNFTLENDKGLAAWCDHYGQIELDYPEACECGQWLRANLTPAGENYIRENYDTMPKQVIEYYGIKKDQE
jgi:hypothetical protein